MRTVGRDLNVVLKLFHCAPVSPNDWVPRVLALRRLARPRRQLRVVLSFAACLDEAHVNHVQTTYRN